MKKKRFRKTKITVIVLLCLGISGCIALFGVDSYMKASVKERILTVKDAEKLKDVDCILILGAGVRNNEPTAMLKDRLDLGIKLYKAGASKRILMSGDHGRVEYDEVNTMKQYAIDAGVPSEDIFMDHAGFSTYESLYRARDIFRVDTMIIITQKYHMYRALYDGKGLGLKAYGVTADPNTSGQAMRNARELLARAKDFLYVIAKPKPTYLGDAIPVSGNGDATNDK